MNQSVSQCLHLEAAVFMTTSFLSSRGFSHSPVVIASLVGERLPLLDVLRVLIACRMRRHGYVTVALHNITVRVCEVVFSPLPQLL